MLLDINIILYFKYEPHYYFLIDADILLENWLNIFQI